MSLEAGFLKGGDMNFAEDNNIKKLLVFPKGKFYFEKYQEWFTFDDEFFDEIIKSFKSEILPRPFVDINHRQDESYGEVVDYELTEDGLYFFIKFNKKGLDLLKEGEYRYISPSFGSITATDGTFFKWYCDSISLTNIPAFLNAIKKIQSQITLKKGGAMKKIYDFLKTKYKLTAETDQAVEDLVLKLLEEGQAKEEIIKSLEAKLEILKKEVEETRQKEEVAKQEVEASKKELARIKDEIKNKEVDDFLLNLVKDKKIDASQTSFWRDLALQDFQKVKNYFLNVKNDLEICKTIVNYDLTNEEIEIAKLAGYDLSNRKEYETFVKSIRKK